MRNFKFFLLSLTFLCCSKDIIIAQNCNLPAPTGFTWTYPTQNTVKFTWNSVPGAWGYQIALNAQNTQGQGQTIQAPTTEATFTYVPNTTYTVELTAGCSATNFSSNKTIVQFTPDGLIIVVDINPGLSLECGRYNLIWSQDLVNFNTTYLSAVKINAGTLYEIAFKHNGSIVKSTLFHEKVSNSLAISKFNLFPNADWGLSGFNVSLGNFFEKANFRKIDGTASMKVNVNYESKVEFVAEGTGIFSDFQIHHCLADEKNNDRVQNTAPVYAASPNPFLDQISVLIKGHIKGIVIAKMFDAAGNLKMTQQYNSETVQDQGFVIQTQDIPTGMYFLQISDTYGVLQTHRLVKQ